jgi:cytosine/adenosine deaminase-related metal-dependent hydrolase
MSRPPIANGAVAVDDGRIAWVGPRAEAPPGELTDFGDSVLLPGLANAHSHLELTALRGFLEDLPFRYWIIRLTKARRDVLTPELLLAAARAGIAEGLSAGVTTYADTCESGVVHRALREMRVRGVMYQEVFGPQPAQCDESMRGLRERVETLAVDDTTLVRTGVSPHAPYSVSDALFASCARYATEHRLPMAIHAAESDAETILVRDGTGAFGDALRARGIDVAPRASSTMALLERTGALDARPLLIHCVQVTDADIDIMKSRGCAVAHCPASNAKLGHGIAPLTSFRQAGLAVGLGTDSVASNNRMDLLDEARLAILMQRARARMPDTVSPAQALELATMGSARALGLDTEIGSLDAGKSADIAVFDLDPVRDTPTFEPAAALVLAGGGRRARFVMVAGQVLVRDGKLVEDVGDDISAVRRATQSLEQFATESR